MFLFRVFVVFLSKNLLNLPIVIQIHFSKNVGNYITVGWDSSDYLILEKVKSERTSETGPKKSEGSEGENEEEDEKHKRWYILERRERILKWCRVYMGFNTQAKVGPLAPGDYYEFRLKVTTATEESEWSDILFAATKDDVIPAAYLHRVVENGPVINLRKILNQRPTSVDIPNKQGNTPLKLALLKDNVSFMGILLNHGADIMNPEVGSGRTPLMTAALYGRLEATQLLLEKGSLWETKDRNGLTALNYAVDNSHFPIVQLAVEEGVNLKTRDKCGWTPLMRGVILKSSEEVLRYLLDNGSDPNESDDRGQTVLMQAVLAGRPEIVKLILEKGGDINAKNVYGHSSYDMAICSSNEGIVKVADLLKIETEEDNSSKKKGKAES